MYIMGLGIVGLVLVFGLHRHGRLLGQIAKSNNRLAEAQEKAAEDLRMREWMARRQAHCDVLLPPGPAGGNASLRGGA